MQIADSEMDMERGRKRGLRRNLTSRVDLMVIDFMRIDLVMGVICKQFPGSTSQIFEFLTSPNWKTYSLLVSL